MRKFVLLPFFVLISIVLHAQIPVGYYDNTTGKTCAALKSTLKQIITKGHNPKSYDELYDQYAKSDIKPREVGSGSTNVIWDIYSDNPTGTDPYNFDPGTKKCGSYSKEGDCYNREHTVPQSWFNSESTPGTDYNHIYPTDGYVNNRRANYVYGEVASASWTSKTGCKVGSSAVAGITGTVFEPIDEYKGDLARIFLYFVTRYQNNIPSWSSNTTAFSHDTFPSVNINYLSMMLRWSAEDPVSQKEINRNNAAYTYQGNRNPFIDHPEYVNSVWNGACPGLGVLPVNIIYFTGTLSGNIIALKWETGNEINFAKFEVEKSFNGSSYFKVADVYASGTNKYTYNDDIHNNRGRRIYYRLKKIDRDGSFTYSEVFTVHVPANADFIVYPNPAKDVINIQLKQSGANLQISLTDMAGKTVLAKAYASSEGIIPVAVNNIAGGTYFIRVTTNGQQYVQKVVISK